jgi:hypothetical protein
VDAGIRRAKTPTHSLDEEPSMNRYLIASVLAVSAAAVNVAFADDITIDPHPFVSSLSRGEVQAQLQQYKAEGVNPWSTSYNPLARFQSGRTRAEVTAEYIQARDEVAALNGEDSGASWLAAQGRRTAPAVLAGRHAPLAR